MKKRNLPFFLFLCLVTSSLVGQSNGGTAFGEITNGGTVFGEITEASTEEVLEFVNVALYKDTSFYISGTRSDKKGMFRFSDLPVGEYHIRMSFVGFETKKTEVFSIESEGQELDLDEISLQISTEVLDIDRKVYNVGKDILASTSSATEILQNIPSVTVDVDGQISLRGSSNIIYFINGKPSAMMRMNSTTALQQIPANMIERVEVITNPSAKYKADGIGGIINILLKENTDNGLNGTAMDNTNGGTVFGEIIEASTEEVLEFVNLALYQDTSFISGTISDKEGLFRFSDLPVGDYHISLSFVGFETKKTEIFSIESEGQEVDLDEISLQISAEVLDMVVVTEEKAIYNLGIDRKVYNVEKDILASTSSATEILQNIPSVTADVDGQISLRGSSNITYFINGRPSAMMRMNSTAALQQIPANMIERVEVITNPSAKYKPDGIGGIINIVLKEDMGNGLNGTAMGNIGNLDRYNGSLSLSYGKDDINAYASYGIRHADTPRDDIENVINKNGNGRILSTFDKNINAQYNEFSHLVNAGIEWELNDWDVLEISGNYFLANNQNVKKISSFYKDEYEPSENELNTTDLVLDETEQEYELGIAFEHQFEEDHALAFEYVYANFSEKEDGYFNEKHRLPTLRDSSIHNLIEIKGPAHEISVEYALPIGEDTEFGAGYVAELMKEDLQYTGEFKPTQETNWRNDPNRTNHFIFTQNIHALYATFGHAIGDFGFLAGLRAEQAYVTSNLVTNNQIIPNDYFKLYPTLHLSYGLSDNQQVQLSYSKRVNRADSDEQNPFEEYVDNYTVNVGNPKLKPEQVHSLELGYRLQTNKFTFLPSIYYRYKEDGFTEILETVNTNITKTTFTNLDTDQSAGLEFILTGKVNKYFKFDLSSNLFYQQIDARSLGFSKDKSAFSWDSKLGLNINITKSTYAQINGYYRSSRITPQGEFNPIILLNAGLRQNIMKNQASIVLTVSDIFQSLDYESAIDTPILYQRTRYGRNSQIVHLGFVYHFGKNIRNQKKQLGFEDELEAGKQVSEEEE